MPERLRNRRTLLAASFIASLLAFYLLYPGGGAGRDGDVVLVTPEERGAAAIARPPTNSPAPEIPATPPPPSTDGLRLHGVTASGAIIGFRNGGQRLVPIGRNVLPGLRLQEVRQHAVLLATADRVLELGFSGPAQPRPADANGTTAAAPRSAEAEARREEILHYRFGLAPRRSDGRITGFAIRPEANLPILRRAGLQAGDVLISVNGQSFDSQEKVQELAGEIAGSFTAEFEFERGGRRMRTSLEVNPRN